jgi:hypothetical protein
VARQGGNFNFNEMECSSCVCKEETKSLSSASKYRRPLESKESKKANQAFDTTCHSQIGYQRLTARNARC